MASGGLKTGLPGQHILLRNEPSSNWRSVKGKAIALALSLTGQDASYQDVSGFTSDEHR